jgi:hypothetical protein
MTPESDLLAALRARAKARNLVRREIEANIKNGFHVFNEKLDAWKPFQVAEMRLTEALIQWEAAEGISE